MNSLAEGTLSHSSGRGIQVQKPELPKGGGAIQGMGESFAPNEFNGTSSLSLPIPATPCRGFEPKISLGYSSGSGNSPFGMGWELSVPEISRQTSKGIPRYDDSDTFLFTGDDYLVPKLDSAGQPVVTRKSIKTNSYSVQSYLPRTEGAFDLIERYTNQGNSTDVFWRVTSKENVVSIFGKSETAKIFDPLDQSRIFKWLLEESYDAKGNHEIYSYKKENADIVPVSGSEQNRDKQTNNYLTQISYGNDRPILDGALITGESGTTVSDVLWHFEVVLDYGAYCIAPSNPDAYKIPVGQTWARRQDPFSSYSAGFEIRTYRLCQNILLFHRFAELNTQPVLTTVLKLNYNESPLLTFLTSSEHIGYQYISADSHQSTPAHYRTRSLPPLKFDYTPFAAAQSGYTPHGYEPFTDADDQNLAQVSSPPNYQLIDLYGEGIPGVLYADGQTIRYQAARQVSTDAVCYGEGKNIAFPISRKVAGANRALTDVTGDGKLDLLVSAPSRAGYYEINSADDWQAFVPFESFPTDYHNPDNSHVDVTGDGLADVLLIDDDKVRVYPAIRQKGYGNPLLHTRDNNVPTSKADASIQILRFTDMVGSGQSQLVRISNGKVECWPSLGYGKFGKRIAMDHAPNFGPTFDTARLLLTDIDGSGTTDLAYISPDHIDIYLNQSGNSFATTPIRISLPAAWDRLDQIQFADVRGNGTSCLVFTQTHPSPRQWFYDFNQTTHNNQQGETETNSQKPHLLYEMDNNMGARTKISYASSTKFYLEDKVNNFPWITRLPFPVNLIESVTHYDDISQTSMVSSYKYHHGYYDGYEREFRGFGRVDRTDATCFDDFAVQGAEQDAAYSSPPTVTKTWYHTGAYLEQEDLLAQYKKEYWSGDTEAYAMPTTAFEYIDSNDKAARNAHRTLHGTVIRSEVYGNDGSPWQDTPYTVSESRVIVKELQKTLGNKYPVFLMHNQESISYDYKRNANDPRISHSCILDIDQFGQVLTSCSVSYGRRATNVPSGMDPKTREKQTKTWITYEENTYINTPEIKRETDFYLLGVEQENKSYEIGGITPASGDYFTFENIKNQINNALTKPSSAIFAKLLHWERDYYYDAIHNKELPLGQVTAHELHHRGEFIEFEKDMAIIGLPPENKLNDLLTSDGTNNHAAKGGFITFSGKQPESDYYWNPGSSHSYDASNFFLPEAFFDPFQYHHIKAGGDSNKAVKTRYTYDPYKLMVNKVVHPLDNQTLITQIDYQHLAPTQMQDINGNLSSVIVDPLGIVIATSSRGTQAGITLSFADLANYAPVSSASLEDLMRQPEKYLQGAAHFFYYDLKAWEKGVPAYTVDLVYDDYTYVNEKEKSVLPNIQKTIIYSDGFGRHLQDKTFLNSSETVRSWDAASKKVESHIAPSCWLTSGAVRYDDKGQPIKKYKPYFSPDYRYVNQKALNEVGYSSTLFYDSMGHDVLHVSPEGFIDKTLIGTWGSAPNPKQYKGYLNQKLYENLPHEFVPSPWSSLSFDAYDSLLDSDYKRTTTTYVDIEAFDKAKKFANTPIEHIEDTMGRTVQSKQLNVNENEKNATFITFDILGNELTSSDQRLHALSKNNFQNTYNLSNESIQVKSADAGITWRLIDVVGNPLYHKDSRKFESYYSYDILHRPVETYVQGGDGVQPLEQTVKKIVYGDSKYGAATPCFQNPEILNLRGKPVISLDEAGLSLTPSFAIHDQDLVQIQWLKSDYKNEADWNGVTVNVLQTLAGAMNGKYQAAYYQRLSLPAPIQTLLEKEVFITTAEYDAIGRVTKSIDADNNTQTPAYYSTNWLKGVTVTGDHDAQYISKGAGEAPSLSAIIYNAKEQRTSVTYGNGVKTIYSYDQMNDRLTGIKSCKQDNTVLQDLTYHHDPVGNVTSVTNNASPIVFFNNQQVVAKAAYTYDTLYRLINATGREHAGLWRNVQSNQNKFNASLFSSLGAQLSDGQALQNYTQTFQYDGAGNLTQIQKTGGTATRKTVIQPDNNRIATSSFGSNSVLATKYQYDASGNMITLEGTAGVTWNYRNNMQSATIIERPVEADGDNFNDAEYYVYDGSGRRVRKVSEQGTAEGVTINEVIYLGGIEIRRTMSLVSKSSTPKVSGEWHSIRMMDGDDCACVWRYWIKGTTKGSYKAQQRYQLNDLLNSSMYELDHQAKIITYEEYYPYGGTSIIAAKNQAEVKNKHYQYSGKEKDMTGLYYYGMRYYCPWLGRWTSADPAGTIDGLNLYVFVGNNPVNYTDPDGRCRTTRSQTKKSLKRKRNDKKDVERHGNELKRKKRVPDKHTGVYFTGFEKAVGDVSNNSQVHKLVADAFKSDVSRGKPTEDFPKHAHHMYKRVINEGGIPYERDTENRVTWTAARLEHYMGSKGKSRGRPADPYGGSGSGNDDRGHDATQSMVSASLPEVDHEFNIKAENMFVNQHIKRGLEEGISGYIKSNPSAHIVLVTKRDYTTHSERYQSQRETYQHQKPDGTRKSYQFNPHTRPKRQHPYVFVNGKEISHMTFKNSKLVLNGNPRSNGKFKTKIGHPEI